MTDEILTMLGGMALVLAGGVLFGGVFVWLIDERIWNRRVASWSKTKYQRKVNAWFFEQDAKYGVVIPKADGYVPVADQIEGWRDLLGRGAWAMPRSTKQEV